MPLIYDFDLPELRAWLQAHGHPAYRAAQLFTWLYHQKALSFEEMTSLPAALRQVLPTQLALPGARVVVEQGSEETHKLLVQFPDRAQVECVAMEMSPTTAPTFCLSTQVGCAMRCAFCASTLQGCERNLTAGEMVAQAALLAARTDRPGNVVFMGMGEPLLNLRHVVGAIERFTAAEAYGLSPQRITVPTVGVVPQIRELAQLNLGVNLAVSLNATRDEQRRELMPGAARWTITELLEACEDFSRLTGGQPVTFAYVLLREVNDFPADAERLAHLLRPLRHHVNLIPFNPVEHALLHRPGSERVQAFLHRLRERGINASVRRSKGTDLNAACGQLRTQASREPRPDKSGS
ncbi:MAG TPA: 23S rRNA (adenine(2503)-C(2))-methyltransferase RlmN [Armatimonadota bacterium]